MPGHRHPHARGTGDNPPNRYHATHREAIDDGWRVDEPSVPPATRLEIEHCRRVITYNQSPDVPFDRSINPYRGCEHGCVYCFARPSHAWLDLSPGLDFETRLFHKPDAPECLRDELAHPGYRPAPIALGINTDAYQPVEKRQRLTRRLLEVLAEARHPLHIITKSALIERDLDILSDMAKQGLAACAVSLTSLDRSLTQRMEPRAAAPARRLKIIRRLTEAGVPVTVMIAPLIPVLTDHELERLLTAAREAGASSASMVLLRLPHEVAGLFEDWLRQHDPDRAEHVLKRLRDCHDGQLYDSRFGQRMTGSGAYAELIAQRFALAAKRLRYRSLAPLRSDRFRAPLPSHGQYSLPGL